MLLETIMVIIVALGTIVNITVMAIKDIIVTNISSIRENIMITIATNRDSTNPVVTGLITIEDPGIIGIVITCAIKALFIS